MTKKEIVEKEPTDPGDTISVHINFKKGLPNYSSIELGASITTTRRDDESDAEGWERAWDTVEREVDNAVSKANKILEN